MIPNLKINLIYLAIGCLIGAFLFARFSPTKVETKIEYRDKYVFVEQGLKAAASKKTIHTKTKADGSSESKVVEESLNAEENSSNKVFINEGSSVIIEQRSAMGLHASGSFNEKFKYDGYSIGGHYEYLFGDIKFNEVNNYKGFNIGINFNF